MTAPINGFLDNYGAVILVDNPANGCSRDILRSVVSIVSCPAIFEVRMMNKSNAVRLKNPQNLWDIINEYFSIRMHE